MLNIFKNNIYIFPIYVKKIASSKTQQGKNIYYHMLFVKKKYIYILLSYNYY